MLVPVPLETGTGSRMTPAWPGAVRAGDGHPYPASLAGLGHIVRGAGEAAPALADLQIEARELRVRVVDLGLQASLVARVARLLAVEQIAEGTDGERIVLRQDEPFARGGGGILVAGKLLLRLLVARISRAEIGKLREEQVLLGPRQVELAVRELQASPRVGIYEAGLEH